MKTQFYLVAASLLLLASCGSNNNESSANTTDTSATAKDSSSAKDSSLTSAVNQNDTKFAVDAANIGMMEIALGKVAQQNAHNKDVKDFGAMMVRDHTGAGDELKRIADNKHITIPAALSADDEKKVDEMKAKTGRAFDKSYIDMMVDGHKKAADEFENEIKQGSDADLRAFATKTLDVIHTHLDSAQKCQMMEKGK